MSRRAIDEIGNKYGELTVIKRATAPNHKFGDAAWECDCSCGNTLIARGNYLRRGVTKSCGCLARELTSKRFFKEILIGTKYGKLTVVRKTKAPNGWWAWECKCDCGNTIILRGGSLRSGHNKSCGCVIPGKLLKEEASFNRIYKEYINGAKKRGHKWELTEEQFRNYTKQSCVYCGAKPIKKRRVGRENGQYSYNGLDRVDNSEGYTTSNVVTCCSICNWAKLDKNLNDFKEWIRNVYNNLYVS